MVKSLFDISLAAVCHHSLCEDLAFLPCDCKQRLLEFFASHDQINTKKCMGLMSRPMFGCNLTRLYFYLSDQLTDDILESLTTYSQQLQHVTIIECPLITDHIGSEGVFYLVFNNPSIRHLCLNHCRGLDDQALYDIAHCIGENLNRLELDFLHNSKMMERAAAIHNLSLRCPNIAQLSLCRFFGDPAQEDDLEDYPSPAIEYRIEGLHLREVDLYGNYFDSLPFLPPTIRAIRLSVTGQENVLEMVSRLEEQRHLITIHLQLVCSEEDARSIENANHFLCHFIPFLGAKITRLHVSVNRLVDTALGLITSMPNLAHLALDVQHLSAYHLRRFFSGGMHSRGAKLRCLKLCRLRITYRALFAIGRGARSLLELETSHMPAVDDRFLALLAENCKLLSCVNFNGCKFVTDKGMTALARNCQLKEVRIRGTACTDKSIYNLAQFCPDVEWIAHSDFSGRPKFSDKALKCLRDSCVQRVIC